MTDPDTISAAIADCIAAAHRNSGMPDPDFRDWKLDTLREGIWQLSYEINLLRATFARVRAALKDAEQEQKVAPIKRRQG
jgi:hypothetical protein